MNIISNVSIPQKNSEFISTSAMLSVKFPIGYCLYNYVLFLIVISPGRTNRTGDNAFEYKRTYLNIHLTDNKTKAKNRTQFKLFIVQ